MKKQAIVVAASKGYTQGLSAFLASYDRYHRKEKEIFILDFDLTPDFVDVQSRKYKYINFIPTNAEVFPEPYAKNPAWATKIPRYKFASELSGCVVMLADADMFFCANIDMYFEIAAAGFIVGGANGSIINYGPAYWELFGEEIDPINYKTIGSVPTILDVDTFGYIFREVYNKKVAISNEGRKSPADFDLINMSILKYGVSDKVLPIPSQQVTGLHHFQLRPDTRIIERNDKLITSDGLEVLMIHGKWWQPNYLNGMRVAMERYATRIGSDTCLTWSKHSIKLILEEFNQFTALM